MERCVRRTDMYRTWSHYQHVVKIDTGIGKVTDTEFLVLLHIWVEPNNIHQSTALRFYIVAC